MKKRITLLLIACMMITMTGCGKTEQAQKVDDMIAAIGPVTEESEDAIEAAETEYEKLKSSEKHSLENRDTLTEARTTYDTLKSDKVIALIDGIGPVSLESGNAIREARQSFIFLTENQQKLVTNENVLTEAETKYETMVIENTENLINAIGTVTLSSGPAITAAEKAYNTLTPEQQKKITNYDTLKAARDSFNAIPPIKLNSCRLKQGTFIYDDFYLSATNISDEIIKEFSFVIFAYDDDNVPVKFDNDFYEGCNYSDLIKPGASTETNRYWMVDGEKTMKKFVVIVKDVEFLNETTWENPQYNALFDKYNEKMLESNDDPNILKK